MVEKQGVAWMDVGCKYRSKGGAEEGVHTHTYTHTHMRARACVCVRTRATVSWTGHKSQ